MLKLTRAFTSSDVAEFASSFKSLPSCEKIRLRDSENPIPCQAARRGKRKILEVCMDNDPWCLTSVDPDFRTPMHWAAINGDQKTCEMLLEKRPERVKIDKLLTVADNYGMSILHCAALSGNENLLCFLLEKGRCAGALCRNKDGLYPIQLACMKGFSSAVAQMCKSESVTEFKAMLDSSGSTLLHLAVMEGHSKVGEVLLEAEVCDLGAKDFGGSTALELAEDLEDTDMAALIAKFQKLHALGAPPEDAPG